MAHPLIVFLADLLQIFKRYQKLAQNELLKTEMNGLQNNDLPGGWTEALKNNIDQTHEK